MTHRSKLFASRCPTAAACCAIAATAGVASVAAPALSKVRRAGEIRSSIVPSPHVPTLWVSSLGTAPLGHHSNFGQGGPVFTCPLVEGQSIVPSNDACGQTSAERVAWLEWYVQCEVSPCPLADPGNARPLRRSNRLAAKHGEAGT